jgi:uncharacterized protein YndB with AHSA1/START domain
MSAEPNRLACVTRRFSASPGRVFDAWLNPEMIGAWMFGPALRDEEVVRLAVDARVGGSFSFVVRRQGEEIDHIGEYLELAPPRRLVFTWGVRQATTDLSRVSIDIVPLEAGCELTLVHELHPDWADYVSRTEAAWTKMLEALATRLG